MTIPAGSEDATELYPEIAAVASQYGDPSNTYTNFLVKAAGSGYVSDASFFWDQPLSDRGFAASLSKPSSSGSSAKPTGSQSSHNNSALGSHFTHTWAVLYGACAVVMAVSFIDFL